MARKLRIFYASDIHGSERCFRKFVNSAAVYGADALILGGDLAGKAIQPIVHLGGGRYRSDVQGREVVAETAEELADLERISMDRGLYPYRAEPGELEARVADGTMEELFIELMCRRLRSWVALADERLEPQGRRIYWMLGNDDPPRMAEAFSEMTWGVHAEGATIALDDEHEMISWGWSNRTPWDSYREMDEADLEAKLLSLCSGLRAPERAVFNLHVPPYASGIDEAPELDSRLQVQTALGQVKFIPAGSVAVRNVIEKVQPLLGVHGHVHEARGFRMLGRTLVLNPGSDYTTGALDGVLVTLERDRVKAHQFVRG